MRFGPLSFGEQLPSAEEGLPALNCFFVSVSRHDRDRIEVQCGFDGLVHSEDHKFEYDVDLVLFVPKTLGLLEVDEVPTLRQEFQSYVRLHSHVSDPKSETSLLRVRDRLQQVKDNLNLETIRVFAIEFEGLLKAQTKRTRKQIIATSSTEELDPLRAAIEATHFLLDEFRAILKSRGVYSVNAEHLERGTIEHDLALLNEYVSHLYVQYLASIHLTARTQKHAQGITTLLEKYSQDESELRQKCNFLIEQRQSPSSSFDEDLYLRRISLLKKYFQKSLFVQVSGESLQKRMMIPVYGMSAALAASWAIMVQLYQAQSLAQRVGINSIALIATAILAYVAKDIMKDFLRRYFFKTSSKWFPDYEKKLYIERNAKKIKLGEIQEYLRSFDSEKLPVELRIARYSAYGGELEEFLHEDVLHFKKRVSLDLHTLDAKKEFPWGLREIIRYRFDRLRTSMEDAFKSMHLISKVGQPSVRQGHRVYHIHLAVWVRKAKRRGQSEASPEFKAYRITLDKSGVLGCEAMKWEKRYGIPKAPM